MDDGPPLTVGVIVIVLYFHLVILLGRNIITNILLGGESSTNTIAYPSTRLVLVIVLVDDPPLNSAGLVWCF